MDKNNSKKAFCNYENDKKAYTNHSKKHNGPFTTEFGEDIISEVVQNEIRVKPKHKSLKKENKKDK